MTTQHDNLPALDAHHALLVTALSEAKAYILAQPLIATGTRTRNGGACSLQNDCPLRVIGNIDAALAAIAAQGGQAAPAWQPIETAPRDGTRILIGRPEDEAQDHNAISTLGWWIEALEDGVDYMGNDAGFTDHEYQEFGPGRSFGAEKYRHAGTQPTHWQPLPAAPNSAPPMQQAKPDAPADLQDTLMENAREAVSLMRKAAWERDIDQVMRWQKDIFDAIRALVQPKVAPSRRDLTDFCQKYCLGKPELIATAESAFAYFSRGVEVAPSETVDGPMHLNVASQCRATATSPLSAQIIVDGGSGVLRELLNDAAASIEALAAARQAKPLTDAQKSRMVQMASQEADNIAEGMSEEPSNSNANAIFFDCFYRAILASQEKQA